jgi:hypothetical protein
MVMLGFSRIKLYVFFAMTLAIVSLGAISMVLWSQIDSGKTRTNIMAKEISMSKADTARWQAAWNDSQTSIRQLRREIDVADTAARQLQVRQRAAVALRQLESRAALNRTDGILRTLENQADARSTIAVPAVHDGFDPIVLAGIHWLQCLQSNHASGGDPAKCQSRASLSSDRLRAAAAPARADHYAPTIAQQLWLLGLVYRFRDWGEACYADKEAMERSIQIGLVR